VPAEVGEVEPQGQAGVKQITSRLDLIGLIVDENCYHRKIIFGQDNRIKADLKLLLNHPVNPVDPVKGFSTDTVSP
jgi:hypothetical protein